MTLRTRLVVALVALSTLGLSVFGVVTYELYQRSLQGRLDDQLVAAINPLSGRLLLAVSVDRSGVVVTPPRPGADSVDSDSTPDGDDHGPGPGFDAYGLLVAADGSELATSSPLVTSERPQIPAPLLTTDHQVFATVSSAKGSSRWRVLAAPVSHAAGEGRRSGVPAGLSGAVVVVAVPAGEIDEQMDRLLRIELAAALALLSALALGAWLVLRRGLRPLEEMAASAVNITAGDLSERVSPADGRTEVGQLGLALNSMLDGIELSFREREVVEARLRRFLADASHELRTPLTSIRGFAELFRLGPDNHDVDLPVIMRRIEEESARMGVLVDDLVTLARLDQTRPFVAEPVDLSVLVADACADISAHDPSRVVTLSDTTGGRAVIQGDAHHLRQALSNLVVNAVRHTPAGSPVEVSLELVPGEATNRRMWRVAVRDHGPGLGPEGLANAFDRFWQADPARTGQGSGLGLSIVHAVAVEHGGRAWAADAHPGARIGFDLPA